MNIEVSSRHWWVVVGVAVLFLGCKGKEGDGGATAGGERVAPAGGVAQSAKFTEKAGCDSSLRGVLQGKTVTLTKKCSPYRVDGQLRVDDDSTLTIEPGVEVQFEAGAALAVGGSGKGRLVAKGTAQAPITFTSANVSKSAGDWEGLFFFEGGAGSDLERVVVEYAGRAERGMVRSNGAIKLTDSVLRNGSSHAIVTDEDGVIEFARNTVENVAKDPVRIEAQSIGGLGEGNRFPAGGAILVEGGDITRSIVVRDHGLPYRVNGESLYIAGEGERGAEVTVQPGVEILFSSPELGIGIGADGPAKLIAIGTEDDPIRFAGTTAEAGAWRGVSVHPEGKLVIERVVIENAGSEEAEGALRLASGGARIVDCVIRGSASSGVNAKEPFAEFKGNTLAANAFADLRIPAVVAGSLGEGNVFDAESSAIEMLGTDLAESATWRAFKAPYLITGKHLTVGAKGSKVPVTLTLEPGVKLIFDDNLGLSIGSRGPGVLKAAGTAAAPITFTGRTPEKASWRGIIFTDTKGSVIDHVVVAWAGQPQNEAAAAITAEKGQGVTMGTVKLVHADLGVASCSVPPKKLETDDVKTPFRKEC